MKKEKNFIQYLFQWLLLVFLFFALVSVVFNVLTYLREREYYFEIIEEEQQNRINYLSKNMNEELTKLKITANMMAEDEQVLELYCKWDFANSFEKNDMLEKIRGRLMELDNLNSFVRESRLYFPDKGIKIDRSGMYLAENEADLFAGMYLENRLLSLNEGKIYIIEVFPRNYLKKIENIDDILSIFIIELNSDQIRQELQFSRMTDQDILFLVSPEEDQIYVMTDLVDMDEMRKTGNSNILKMNGEKYHLMSSDNNGDFFHLYYLQDQGFLHLIQQKMILSIFLFIAVILLSIIFAFLLFFRKIFRPLEVLLVDAFGQIKRSNFSYRIPLPGKGEVFRNLYENFNYMAERIDVLISRELKQQILINQANFKHLQAQINPHFMYNSYFLLYRLIKKRDIEGSLVVCENLGNFFQYITRDSGDSKSLEEEIRHARSYAVIQAYRFQNKIQIDFPELPEKYGYVEVPRLIVQPLIENVFKYVVGDLDEEEEVQLRVSYEENEEDLLVIVENSGSISDEMLKQIQTRIEQPEEGAEVTALVNINSRLNLFFKQKSSLAIRKSSLGGLKIILYLKL
ncbi:MAG TPA: histidine kinase [Candidatus Eisenbergiella stercoravium]|nr:histidine kinase [Candidatus Eisenbergiella stercoravium]